MLTESGDFRALYSTELDEILNHRLTDEWIEELVASCRREAARFDLEDGFLDINSPPTPPEYPDRSGMGVREEDH